MARRGRAQPVRNWWVSPQAVVSSGPTAGDLPPVPIVAHAIEVIGSAWVFVERPFAEQVVANTDAPLRPVIVGSQPEPFFRQPAQVFVGRTPAEILVPLRPVIAGSQPEPFFRQPAQVLVGHTPAEPPVAPAGVPQKPVIVGAQPAAPQPAQILVGHTPTEPPVAPAGVPPKPLIVAAQPLPIQPPQTYVERLAVEADAPARPAVPVVVAGSSVLGEGRAIIHRSRAAAAVVAGDTPTKPLVQSLPWHSSTAGGQVWVSSLVPEAPAAATPTPPKPTIATPEPQWHRIVDGRVVVRRPPYGDPPVPGQVASRPTIVAPQWHPARGGGQVWVSSLVPEAPAPADPGPPIPPRPVVLSARPLPQHQQTPFTHVGRNLAPPYGVPVPPVIAGGASLASGGLVFIHPRATEPPAPPPQVPIKPLVVGAQPLPLPTQAPFSHHAKVEPPAPPPQVPIKPLVVGAQPLPLPTQAPFSYHAKVAPPPAPQVPIKPLVVGAQPLPPYTQGPYRHQSRFTPPPDLRRPQTPIIFDVSRPPLPTGRAIIRKGFAEALPLLFEGVVTGGVLSGSSITGAGAIGGSLTGFSRDGYVTGGVR